MHTMETVLLAFAVYATIGLMFAIAFVIRGAAHIDAAAQSAPLRVRLAFAPGALALWPVLGIKWARAGKAAP